MTKKLRKITLEVGRFAHSLYAYTCKNSVSKDPTRFILLEGTACTVGTMYWCDTYLEAIATRAYFKGVAIYSDEVEGTFVVISKKRFK